MHRGGVNQHVFVDVIKVFSLFLLTAVTDVSCKNQDVTYIQSRAIHLLRTQTWVELCSSYDSCTPGVITDVDTARHALACVRLSSDR